MKTDKENYQKEMDSYLGGITPGEKRLLLHACCAPCSSYVLEYLSEYFRITVLFYDPNIFPEAEYLKRIEEEKRFIREKSFRFPVDMAQTRYDPERFFEMAKGLEDCPERGERCIRCYRLRMEEAASYAKENGYDLFATTLTLSPLKDADALNGIGRELEEQYGVKYLASDFKKKDGYKRSLELSREYNLYRQNYCGCIFSQKEERI
ncbi:MAG: epoxyqueuosine reductase QueH [Lachnospiraceae bacterium]|nr:epoxyqueuosine reductase QueH [Lachnospiraceae bacterium]